MQGRDHHPQLQGTHGGPGGLEGSQVRNAQAQQASDSADGLPGSQSGLRKARWSRPQAASALCSSISHAGK